MRNEFEKNNCLNYCIRLLPLYFVVVVVVCVCVGGGGGGVFVNIESGLKIYTAPVPGMVLLGATLRSYI